MIFDKRKKKKKSVCAYFFILFFLTVHMQLVTRIQLHTKARLGHKITAKEPSESLAGGPFLEEVKLTISSFFFL